jgi:hypothetical protein
MSAKEHIPVGLQESGHCVRDGFTKTDDIAKTAIDYYIEAQRSGVFAAACDALNVELTLLKMKQPTHLNSCEQAATQNAVYAQEILVDVYTSNDNLKNNERALFWLEQAAPKSGKSAYRYALTLNSSDQIPKVDVLYWFEKSATLGYVPAYLETAASYYNQINTDTTVENRSAYLAKSYMWVKAWLARKDTAVKSPQWIEHIFKETPKSWHAELGKKVEEHIQQFTL